MLVLARKTNEKIIIGDDIEITVLSIRGNTVRLAIDAPCRLGIRRLTPRGEPEGWNEDRTVRGA